ncbi:hypothetical protein [Deinococcus sp. LM3]|uniref:hypothetical protein n=1 Tax=Deinococcus sp. LM3 TaxID=1938608 RepID=UPI001180B326|nr:hypothetical protein [Deinococcus sp. LM3]
MNAGSICNRGEIFGGRLQLGWKVSGAAEVQGVRVMEFRPRGPDRLALRRGPFRRLGQVPRGLQRLAFPPSQNAPGQQHGGWQ